VIYSCLTRIIQSGKRRGGAEAPPIHLLAATAPCGSLLLLLFFGRGLWWLCLSSLLLLWLGMLLRLRLGMLLWLWGGGLKTLHRQSEHSVGDSLQLANHPEQPPGRYIAVLATVA
jgi:hypothetical protein